MKRLIAAFKQYLDGNDPLEMEGQINPIISPGNAFFVAVARRINETMEAEMFTPPGCKTYVPLLYIIYLSVEDDREWRGEKRIGFCAGLQQTMNERVRELAGASNSSIQIELRVDETLPKGQMQVVPVWDRSQPSSPIVPTDTNLTSIRSSDGISSELYGLSFAVQLSCPGIPIGRYISQQNTLLIGRNCQRGLNLDHDPTISRRQAELRRLANDCFQLTCLPESRNSIEVAGKEVTPGTMVEISGSEPIQIGVWQLRILSSVLLPPTFVEAHNGLIM